MAEWVRLCAVADVPGKGQATEAEAAGVGVCLANVAGELSAVDNRCPHRGGPLGQGFVEGESVVCPWHSWTFNLKTGVAEHPVQDRVAVYPLRIEDENVLIFLPDGGRNQEENIS